MEVKCLLFDYKSQSEINHQLDPILRSRKVKVSGVTGNEISRICYLKVNVKTNEFM